MKAIHSCDNLYHLAQQPKSKSASNQFSMTARPVAAGPSYPMGLLGPGPEPPSLRGPQIAHALFFHLVK